jgi:hypothetical protein
MPSSCPTTVHIPRTVSTTVHFLNSPAMYLSTRIYAPRIQKSLLRLPNAFVVHIVKTSLNQWCQSLRQYATQLHTNCTKGHNEISHSKTGLFLGSPEYRDSEWTRGLWILQAARVWKPSFMQLFSGNKKLSCMKLVLCFPARRRQTAKFFNDFKLWKLWLLQRQAYTLPSKQWEPSVRLT